MLPLNGTKTHPLTEHAWSVLVSLALLGPEPAQETNPGVINRLERENLAERFLAPTPYRTRKGNIPWLRITEAGRFRLSNRQ